MIDYRYYLLVGALLFTLGLIGFMIRRNLIVMFLCTELMLSGIIVNLVGFNRHWLEEGKTILEGQAFTIFLLVIAAAEAALALALVLVLQKRKNTLDASAFNDLKG